MSRQASGSIQGHQAPDSKQASRGALRGRALQATRRPDTPPSRLGYRKPASEAPQSGGLWDIPSWCREAKVSRTKLYAMWGSGTGPRKVVIGASVRILESPLQYAERLAKDQAAQEVQR